MSSSENLRGQIIKKSTLRLKITEIYVKIKYKLMRNKLVNVPIRKFLSFRNTLLSYFRPMCLLYTPSKRKEILVFDILWWYTKKNKCLGNGKENFSQWKGDDKFINKLFTFKQIFPQ